MIFLKKNKCLLHIAVSHSGLAKPPSNVTKQTRELTLKRQAPHLGWAAPGELGPNSLTKLSPLKYKFKKKKKKKGN